jgi:two-component system KDP operon response regulator KdpE
LEVSHTSSCSIDTITPEAVSEEPAARATRISGFSAPELAHTLRALTPSSVDAVSDAFGRDRSSTHCEIGEAHPTAFGDPPLVLFIAVAGTSSLAPLRARLARVVEDAHGAPMRIFYAETAAHAAARVRPDAVLTRIERHDPSAIAGIAALRDTWGVPIAATIAPSIAIASDIDELVAALDDYLIEPVRADEVLIRIRCLVSRRRRAMLARDQATSADTLLHIDDCAKLVTLHGRTLRLTPKEFELLRLLASQPGRVFSDAEIIDQLWPGSPHAAPVDVAQYVHRLRKKLGDNPCAPQWIFNVKRFGYMLRRLAPQFSPMVTTLPTAIPPTPPMRASSHFDSP